jgi:hypothetical protein
VGCVNKIWLQTSEIRTADEFTHPTGGFSTAPGHLSRLRNLFAGASRKKQAELKRRIERVRDEFAETIGWLRKCHHGHPTLELQHAQARLLARLDHVPEDLREAMRTVEQLATKDWPTLMPMRTEELARSGRAEIAEARARLTKPLSP